MTKQIDDGVIKFNFKLDKTHKIESEEVEQIESFRKELYNLTLIGEYLPQSIGYGNLSYRVFNDEFIISGTQTGKHPELTSDQYSHVYKSDLNTMKVLAQGKCAPSSESLTHYAIYKSCPQINYILHIHNNELWKFMLENDYTQTKKEINYGTTEMAQEAQRCIGRNSKGIFAMSGHEDGIISYGKTAAEAMEFIEKLIEDSGVKF